MSDPTMEQVTERCAHIDAQIKALYVEREQLLNAWAQACCPLKVGEVTQVRGYRYAGKSARVTKIIGQISFQKPAFRAFATVLKGDGTDSKQFTDWRIEGV